MSRNVAESVSPSVTENVSSSVYDGRCQFLTDEMKSAADTAAANDVDTNEVSTDTCSGLLHDAADTLQLLKIFVYPIKSCAAVQVNSSLVPPCIVFSGHYGVCEH